MQGLDIEVLAETIGEIRALWQVTPLSLPLNINPNSLLQWLADH